MEPLSIGVIGEAEIPDPLIPMCCPLTLNDMSLSVVRHPFFVPSILFCFSFGLIRTTSAVTLYSTDFPSPPYVENNEWAGVDGWIGLGASNTNDDRIIDNAEGGLAGFLGLDNGNNQSIIGIYRNIDYDPVAEGNPVVTISLRLGIQSSDNGHDDSFRFDIFSDTGNDRLASIGFDTSTETFFRYDGTTTTPLGVSYPTSGFFTVVMKIDFAENTWTVSLEGAPIFEDVTFTDPMQGFALDLGSVDFKWIPTDPSNSGNNFMAVDSVSVAANPPTDFRPTIAPKPKRVKTSRRRVTIRGTAADDNGVNRVEYKAGKGGFKKAKGTSRWRAKVTLDRTRTKVLVRSVDTANQRSKKKKVIVIRK